MSDISEIEKKLRQFGVEIRDLTGSYKTFSETMDQLSIAFNRSVSEEETKEIIDAIVGE